jgi:hypothetical protein
LHPWTGAILYAFPKIQVSLLQDCFQGSVFFEEQTFG